MTTRSPLPRQGWASKFRCAFRGVERGVRSESSFYVHFGVALAVIVAAALLRVSLAEWCVLLLCITAVLAAEMFNSALEQMAKAVTLDEHPRIADALDISSAGVLIACIGASVVGTIVFGHRLAMILGWA